MASGAQGGRILGTNGFVTIDSVDYDIRHYVELTPNQAGYRIEAGWALPVKLDAAGSGGNVVSNAQTRRNFVTQPKTVDAFFPVRMGESAIKTAITAFLDSLANVTVGSQTPGIHTDTRSLINAMVTAVVNPAATENPVSEISDPNTPVTP
jgi:hypothetical protein